MRVAFYVSDKQRDVDLAQAFRGCFDTTIVHDGIVRDGFDLHCIIGLKHQHIRDQLDGRPYLYWDKPFDRTQWPTKWRVSYREQQPTRLIFSEGRAFNRGMFAPWRDSGEHIVLGGWSAKASRWFDIDPPETYLARVVSDRRIVYRPKPSYRDAHPIPGTEFSPGGNRQINDDLRGAHALVTYASGTCVDAMIAGVPCIVLGPGSMRSISSTCLDNIEHPRLATDDERRRMLCNLGHHQWALDELRSGVARPALMRIMQK